MRGEEFADGAIEKALVMIDKILSQASGRSLFSTPAQSRAQSAATLIETIAKSDPEKAKELQNKKDKLDSVLNQLQASKQDASAQKKEAARQKIEQIKAQLQALRYLAASNPKAAARQAKQLARELSQAVKDYAGGGGSAAVSTNTAVPAETGANPAAAQNAATAGANPATAATQPAEAIQGTPVATDKASPSGTTTPAAEQVAKTTGQPDEKTKDAWQTASEKLKAEAGEKAAQDAFVRDIRRIMTELKSVIEAARKKLKDDTKATGAMRNLDQARQALAETAGTLNDMTAASNSALSGGSTATAMAMPAVRLDVTV